MRKGTRYTRKKKNELEGIKGADEFANYSQHHRNNGLKALSKGKELEAQQMSEGRKWVTLENGAKVLR